MQKIGVLGGMFDPIHRGHIHAARRALAFGLDRVLLLPCLSPAHRDAPLASADDRLRMCEIAARGSKRITVSDIDLREGPCYAADTLRILQRRYPDAQLYWIIGADKLTKLSQWRDAEYLLSHCEFLICPRPGYDAHLPVPGAKLHVLPGDPLRISSGEVRRKLSACDDALKLIFPSVSRYIAENGLYQMDFLPALLERGMQASRLAHTMGVRSEAVKLAYLHGASMQKASVAAMLHDIAKPLPLEQMQALAQKYALQLPEEILSDGNLLHGPVAAAIAEHELLITDPPSPFTQRARKICPHSICACSWPTPLNLRGAIIPAYRKCAPSPQAIYPARCCFLCSARRSMFYPAGCLSAPAPKKPCKIL